MSLRLETGELLAGRYRLEAFLGEGGMGVVWSALDEREQTPVAVKLLKSDDPDARRRFRREGRAVAGLSHDSVVRVLDVFELADGAPGFAMELLAGESMRSMLARRGGKLELSEVAAILMPVVSAVEAAHAAGLVHRDLKPENVFIASEEDGSVAIKVLDFGIAKLLTADSMATISQTTTGAMLGTPYYMAPEQALGETTVDHRADVWSLGIILYHAVTGVLPTRADNVGKVLRILITHDIPPLEEVMPSLPADVLALVGRMLSSNPEDRPTLAEVREVLVIHAADELPAPPPATRPPRAWASGERPASAAEVTTVRRRMSARTYAVAIVSALGVAMVVIAVRASPSSAPVAPTPIPTEAPTAPPEPSTTASTSRHDPPVPSSLPPASAASSSTVAPVAPPVKVALPASVAPSASVAPPVASAKPVSSSLEEKVVTNPPF